MGESHEDGAARLEVQTSGKVDVGLLPEGVQKVLAGFGLDFDLVQCYARIIQLKTKAMLC